MSTDNDDDKPKLAALVEQFGDKHRDLVVKMIKHMLRALADGATHLADQHAQDPWSNEWVARVRVAAADLRAAEAIVQVQPSAPHGKVPS